MLEILDVDDGNDFAVVEDRLQVSPGGDDGDAVDLGSGDVRELGVAGEEGGDADEHVVALAVGGRDVCVCVGESDRFDLLASRAASATTRWRPRVASAGRVRSTRSECRRDDARCLRERGRRRLLFSRSRRSLLEGW